MANTYTRLHVHIVFAVKFRVALLHESWEETLHKYITGIVQHNGHKLLVINSVPDHLHMLIGLNPTQSLSMLMQFVKGDSSEFINKNKLVNSQFNWQAGYGAFSTCNSHKQAVINYIINQKQHHRKTSFKEEYNQLLIENEVSFEERFSFQDLID